MITVLCYKKCTTCQKAFKWLDANGVEYKERAIKEENPTYEELKTWYEKNGRNAREASARSRRENGADRIF